MRTHNHDRTHYSAGHPLVEFFAKAGSLFEKRGSYYGKDTEATALDLFLPAWAMDREKAFRLALWCRDARGGAGNRSGARAILRWLAMNHPEWVESNVAAIPRHGRWDDLICLFGTPAEPEAAAIWASAIQGGDRLACKWAPRENKVQRVIAKALRKRMGLTQKDYRRLLASATVVVESQMCARQWDAVKYDVVPSVAIGRYRKAFSRRDEVRFGKWLEDLKNPEAEAKVNAGAVFPHDVVRLALAERGQEGASLADAQFAAMPDHFATGMRVMPVVDSSGSMTCEVSGSIRAMDVAFGLGLYASDRVGKANAFYRRFLIFSTDSQFYDWRDRTFSEALMGIPNIVASTNLAGALEKIAAQGRYWNVPADQMPNCLILVSDMQFDSGVRAGDPPSVERALATWDAAAYARPRMVYWNTAGYAGSPSTVYDGVALVSGFSPAILKAVFEGDDLSPVGIMERAIAKYEVVIP